MRLTNLDMDVLRTLAVATELGNFARAAERLGRSQSAISLQMRKLEEQVGQTLFKKQGRGVAMTEAGDVLLSYARRILDLNDEAIAASRGVAIEGSVRFGLPHDLAGRELAMILAKFRRAHPNVHIETRIDRNLTLHEQLGQGVLDMIVTFGPTERGAAAFATALPFIWISSRGLAYRKGQPPGQPLPLVLLDPPCLFRQAAIEALERARIPWRIAFTSPSLAGLWAATEAGLGFTLRTPAGLPEMLEAADPKLGLPPLAKIGLGVYRASNFLSPAAERLQSIIIETVEQSAEASRSPLHAAL